MSDASDVPAVRYLTAPAYTPPAPFKTWWVRHNGLDLDILEAIQSGQGDLKLDNLLIAADAGREVDLYSDFDQDEPTYDGSSLVATLSLSDAGRLRDWLTAWLERQ